MKKVIAFGLPMKMKTLDDGGAELHGFWSTPYTFILAPIDAFFNGGQGFGFMEYEGSYWKALWHFLFGSYD